MFYISWCGVAFLSTKPQDVWVNALCWVSGHVKTQKGLYNNGQRTYFLLFLLQNKVYKLDKARMLEIMTFNALIQPSDVAPVVPYNIKLWIKLLPVLYNWGSLSPLKVFTKINYKFYVPMHTVNVNTLQENLAGMWYFLGTIFRCPTTHEPTHSAARIQLLTLVDTVHYGQFSHQG